MAAKLCTSCKGQGLARSDPDGLLERCEVCGGSGVSPPFKDLIERSSLGSPGAKSLRTRTPSDIAEKIVDELARQAVVEHDDAGVGAETHDIRLNAPDSDPERG